MLCNAKFHFNGHVKLVDTKIDANNEDRTYFQLTSQWLRSKFHCSNARHLWSHFDPSSQLPTFTAVDAAVYEWRKTLHLQCSKTSKQMGKRDLTCSLRYPSQEYSGRDRFICIWNVIQCLVIALWRGAIKVESEDDNFFHFQFCLIVFLINLFVCFLLSRRQSREVLS